MDVIIGTRRFSRRQPAGGTPPVTSEFVQGVERCFAVIRAFGPNAQSLTIAGVAQRSGLTRSVARRYLFTLRELGFVVQHGALFSMTPRILDLGFTYLSTIDVARVAQPFMEQAVERLHESCSAAILDGTDIVYVVRVPARRIMSANLVLGSRLPAHATSLGKVLLAYADPRELDAYLALKPLRPITRHTIVDERVFRRVLEDVRKRGWAAANDESEVGVRSIAAPVYNHRNKIEAAVNVAGHASRLSMKQLRDVCLPVLLQTTEQISRTLGAAPHIADFSAAARAAGLRRRR
jgi:IclR family transcriptional regulator, pca regulon regulatory protein